MFVMPYDIGQFPAAGPRGALTRGVELISSRLRLLQPTDLGQTVRITTRVLKITHRNFGLFAADEICLISSTVCASRTAIVSCCLALEVTTL